MEAMITKNDVMWRLADIIKLEDGWFDGEGKAFDLCGMTWLAETFDKYYDASAMIPYVYPTVEGHVSFEWEIPNADVSLIIDTLKKTGEFSVLYIQADMERKINYDLNLQVSWQYITANVQSAFDFMKKMSN